MRLILSTLTILIGCHSLFAQEFDSQRMGKLGVIKRTTELFYKSSRDTNIANYIHEYFLDTNGTVIKSVSTMVDRNELYMIKHYSYNSRGLKIREDVESFDYGNGGADTSKYSRLYKYNENGHLISDNGLPINYTYDSQDRIITEIHTSKQPSYYRKFTYTYNEQGQVSEKNEYRSSNVLVSTMKFSYNDAGNLKSSEYSKPNNKSSVSMNLYNEKGLLSMIKYDEDSDRLKEQFRYEFKN